MQSTTGVIIAGCVLTILGFAPLLVHAASGVPVAIQGTSVPATQLSLPAAASAGTQNSSDMHFVDLKSFGEKHKGMRSTASKAALYTSYANNTFADESTARDSIQPSLMPQARSTYMSAHQWCSA